MSRWKAAGIHLAISLLVIGSIATALILAWYGWPLFKATGGGRLLMILAVVDLVIGPLLTAIVFKAGKPSLKLDLTIIALLQAGFLAYGLHILADSRPIFMVGVLDRFELVFSNDVDDADLAKGQREEYTRRSWNGPVLVGGRMGETSEERMNLALSGLDGKDIHQLPERYTDYQDVRPGLLQQAKPAAELADISEQARDAVQAAAQGFGRELDSLAYLPINSKRGRASMLIDKQTGDIVGPVAVDPWEALDRAAREAAQQ